MIGRQIQRLRQAMSVSPFPHREFRKIESKIRSAGMTVVPTKAYFSNGKVKLEIAIASGKQAYDKRDAIEREEARRAIRSHL